MPNSYFYVDSFKTLQMLWTDVIDKFACGLNIHYSQIIFV